MIDYESPVFISILLYTIYVLLIIAVGLTFFSMVRSLRIQGKGDAVTNRIPARRIAIGTALLMVFSLLLTYLTAGTSPLNINGKTFADTFWLRTSDMLINTSLILIAVAALGTALGLFGLGRKLKQ